MPHPNTYIHKAIFELPSWLDLGLVNLVVIPAADAMKLVLRFSHIGN